MSEVQTMDDEARAAINAYHRTIRVYRNPYRDAPEFRAILHSLQDANEYYRLIPQFEMRPEQIILARKVLEILDRRHHVSVTRKYIR
jgi:hypothetical protein